MCHITMTDTSPLTGSSCCQVAKTNTAVYLRPDFAWHRTSISRIARRIYSCGTRYTTYTKYTRERRQSGLQMQDRILLVRTFRRMLETEQFALQQEILVETTRVKIPELSILQTEHNASRSRRMHVGEVLLVFVTLTVLYRCCCGDNTV